MPTVEDLRPKFRARYGEFDSKSDGQVDYWTGEALTELSESAWGLCYERALIAHAAHNLALSELRKAGAQTDSNGNVQVQQAGVINSASADGLSVGFAQSAAQSGANDNDSLYGQTPYGQEYLALKRRCLRRARIAEA